VPEEKGVAVSGNGRFRKPRKLTKRIIAAFEAALSVDYRPRRVCAVVGIGKSTFYRWIGQGEKDAAEGRQTLCRDLWDARARARERWEHELLARIAAAAEPFLEESTETVTTPDGKTKTTVRRTRRPGDWRSAAWLLTTRLPSTYARPLRRELERLREEMDRRTEADMAEFRRQVHGILARSLRGLPEESRRTFGRLAGPAFERLASEFDERRLP
jgi:hypothetical protein